MPDIWRRLDEVGLHSKQTGMDNVRGVCGCPVAGLTPHELFDASPVVDEFNAIIVGNKEFTNLPRKFNVTITGCLENCCHPETQDIGLVPAYRELDGQQVNGFNVLVGGKQGSGGYRPATPLDVFVAPEEAAALCARSRASSATTARGPPASAPAWPSSSRTAASAGSATSWSAASAGRCSRPAPTCARSTTSTISASIRRSTRRPRCARLCTTSACCVPVGRITTAQMRGVADLAERYGNGDIRVTVGQNLIIPNIPEDHASAL